MSDSAESQWIARFMRQHGCVIQKKTHTDQKKNTPQHEMDDFVKCIEFKRQLLGIADDSAIVNTDETIMHFSLEFQCAVAEKGSKMVYVAEPNSSSHCTCQWFNSRRSQPNGDSNKVGTNHSILRHYD